MAHFANTEVVSTAVAPAKNADWVHAHYARLRSPYDCLYNPQIHSWNRPVWASGILAEIGDIAAVHSSDALAKYTGLTWLKNDSGDFTSEG